MANETVELTLAQLHDAKARFAEGGPGVLAALAGAGLVRDDAVVPYVARMLAVVGAPTLLVKVERFAGEDTSVEMFWVAAEAGVWATQKPDRRLELRELDRTRLAETIRRTIGLRSRPIPGFTGTLRINGPTLERTIKLLEHGRRKAQRFLAKDAQLDEPARAAVIDAFIDRPASHRLGWAWNDAAGRQTQSLSVIDGGAGGLWLSRREGTAEAPVVCLQPTTDQVVSQRISALCSLGALVVPEPPAEAGR